VSGPAAGSATEPSLQIVGAGLLGTSVGLALAGTAWTVWVADADPAAQRLAGELGAGQPGWASADPDLVLLCVPPSAMLEAMHEAIRLFPTSTFSDVASIKTQPEQNAETLGCLDRFVGGHPMAGRERSGAAAAQSDLFDARPWAICPPAGAEPARVALVERLARSCGADPLLIDAASHDRAVALVSHLPQVAASAVAGQLGDADVVTMTLAGQGLRDTVRIAGSDTELWVDILTANAAALAPLVQELASELGAVGAALAAAADSSQIGGARGREIDKPIRHLLDTGRHGFGQIPGKHGAPPVEYAVIPVVIPDEPGALARLFATVATAGSSVEDIHLEHSPGHPVGIIELSVRPDQAPDLVAALHADGWSSH
jgi:prephenate dehydrogenase